MGVILTPSGKDMYAELTPAGAFYATSTQHTDTNRALLLGILRDGDKKPFSVESAMLWSHTENVEEALKNVYRLQKLGMVYGTPHINARINARLEDTLPPLLGRLSAIGKALLADENGFYIAAAGIPHESAEELAGLSADLMSLQSRHGRLLKNNLRISTESWGLMDSSGRSELGFWPIYIGKQCFMLVIMGTPRLHDQSLVTLVKELDNRYR